MRLWLPCICSLVKVGILACQELRYYVERLLTGASRIEKAILHKQGMMAYRRTHKVTNFPHSDAGTHTLWYPNHGVGVVLTDLM